MKRDGGLFSLGDVIPSGYFTEEEIADLVSRGKVTISESRQVEIGAAEPPVAVEPPAVVEPPVAVESEERESFVFPTLLEDTEEIDEPEIDLGDLEKQKPKKRGRKTP